MSSRRRPLIFGLVILSLGIAISALLLFRGHFPGPGARIVIATATEGGTYDLIGKQLAATLADLHGIECADVQNTAGSAENINLLIAPRHVKKPGDDPDEWDYADVALVQKTALLIRESMRPADLRKIRALAYLYDDVVQVVVRNDAEINSPADLKEKKTYVGKDDSGTRQIAVGILRAVGVLGENEEPASTNYSYTEAAKKLEADELDAAFFASGTPTPAVKAALASGECRLLDLGGDVNENANMDGLEPAGIPPNTYENQDSLIHSVSTDVILVCRADLEPRLAQTIVAALFDNATDLIRAHAKAQDIKFGEDRFEDLRPLDLHSGVERFRKEEEGKLHILTGAINGRYYEFGESLQSVLKTHGIEARVVHTDGSIENARRLNDGKWPAIAIMQYDTALATLSDPELIYGKAGKEGVGTIPPVQRLRRLATLWEDKVHIIIRKDLLPNEDDPHPTVDVLKDPKKKELRVCLGPKESATQILARVILNVHGVEEKWNRIQYRHLSVIDMVNRLNGNEIDVGFFVSAVPTQAVKTILASRRYRLLSVEPTKVADLVGGALRMSTIKEGSYGSQAKDEPEIETLSTYAVLVAREDVEADVKKITKAMFEGVGFLHGFEGGKETLKKDLPSLKLHPQAEKYYMDTGLLPAPEKVDWLGVIWRSLAILVMLVGGYKGLHKLQRDRASHRLARQIFAVGVDADEPHSATKLSEIRTEIGNRVKRRWWAGGELDKRRWRDLKDLIDSRMKEAMDTLMRTLLREIRALEGESGEDDAERQSRSALLENRVWRHLENGELTTEQHGLLLKLIQKRPRKPTP